MKTIISFIGSHRIAFGIVVVLVIVSVVAGGWYRDRVQSESKRTEAAYLSYRELAQANEDAAALPAAENNPIRQQLGVVLARILTEKMSDAERLTLAEQGTVLVKQLDAQIDEMGKTGSSVSAYLDGIENVGRFGKGFTTTGASTTDFISLAKQEASIIQDIRGLSYRADYEIQVIFNHIIADKGKLSSQYIVELNNSIPEVEKEFDRRTNLYTELQKVSGQIDKLYTDSRGINPYGF